MRYFDIVPESKKPAVRWSDQSTWKDGPPQDGVWHAVPCGEVNGCFVVDLDVRDDRNGLQSLAEAFPGGLPDTRTVQTKHGWHLYFNYPSEGLKGRIAMLPGVDVKSQGGYVIGPGTPGYRVVVDLPIADAPEELLALIRRQGEAASGESAIAISPEHPEFDYRCDKAATFLAAEPPCVAGKGGDQQLLKVSLRLMRTYELPVQTALDLLEPYNARCAPPWSHDEMARKLYYAAEHGTGPVGCAPAGFALTFGTLPDDAPWPPPYDPEHVYQFDAGVELHGGDHSNKMAAIQDRSLGALFVGRSASPDWCGVFRWDAFRERTIAVNPPMKLEAETKWLSNNDLTDIRFWVTCRVERTVTSDRLAPVIEAAARLARFHPICDYLDGLQKVPLDQARAYFEKSAERLWGGTELESEMFKRQCIAAVRRVRKPGCKADDILILHGPQAYRKSSLLAKMFGEFFLDQFHNDFSHKDAADALQGRWGIEVPEITAASSRKEENARKSFLSRTEDVYRAAYARLTESHPRQCVFFASTNDDDLLTDPTGNRRYNIVHISKEIDVEGFDRDEFWACANVLEAAGDSHFFTRLESELLAAHRQEYTTNDPWDEGVAEYLKKCRDAGGQWISAGEVLTKCIAVPVDKQNQAELNRVSRILRGHLGERKSVRFGTQVKKVYSLAGRPS